MTDALNCNGHQNIGIFCVRACIWWISGSLYSIFIFFFAVWRVIEGFYSFPDDMVLLLYFLVWKQNVPGLLLPHQRNESQAGCDVHIAVFPSGVVFIFAKCLGLLLLLMEFQCYVSIDRDDGNYVALFIILLFQGQFSNPCQFGCTKVTQSSIREAPLNYAWILIFG